MTTRQDQSPDSIRSSDQSDHDSHNPPKRKRLNRDESNALVFAKIALIGAAEFILPGIASVPGTRRGVRILIAVFALLIFLVSLALLVTSREQSAAVLFGCGVVFIVIMLMRYRRTSQNRNFRRRQ